MCGSLPTLGPSLCQGCPNARKKTGWERKRDKKENGGETKWDKKEKGIGKKTGKQRKPSLLQHKRTNLKKKVSQKAVPSKMLHPCKM